MEFQLLHLLANNLHADQQRDEQRDNRIQRLIERGIDEHPKEDIHFYIAKNIIGQYNVEEDNNSSYDFKACWCQKRKLYFILQKYMTNHYNMMYVCNSFFTDIENFEDYANDVIEPNYDMSYECQNDKCRNQLVPSKCNRFPDCDCCVVRELYYVLQDCVEKSLINKICEEMFGPVTAEGKSMSKLLCEYEVMDEVNEKISCAYYEEDEIYQACIRLLVDKKYEIEKKQSLEKIRYDDEYITDMKKMFYWLAPCKNHGYDVKNQVREQFYRGEVPIFSVERYLGYVLEKQPYNTVSVTIIESQFTYKVIINGNDELYMENIHKKPFGDKSYVLYNLYKKNVFELLNAKHLYGFSKDLTNLVCTYL